MHQLCSPCRLRYDFIGHYETLAGEAAYVLDKLGVDQKVVRFPETNSHHGGKNSSSRVDQMMRQLSGKQLAGLRQLYRLDFELFGYD